MSHLEKERKLYTVLGLPDLASIDEVRKAYKKEAIKCHPDKNPGNTEAAELFKLINHAHQVLTDKNKKAAYDRVLNSDTSKFVNSVYKESHMSDVDRARRQREQDLMRKRANRNNSGRPSVSRMPEKEKEHWAKRDQERERDLKQKMQREKEALYNKELEKQRRDGLAKQRADEGRRRESERAARLEREKEIELQRQHQEGLAQKEKANMERHRQDEARKRELERQIIRHQKQAEKIKEQRLQEEQDKWYASQSDARDRMCGDEEDARKAVMVEQLKVRRASAEDFRKRRVAIQHCGERCDVEYDEEEARVRITADHAYVSAQISSSVREFETRFLLLDEECLARCVMFRHLRAGVKYWHDAYGDRERLLISHKSHAASLAAAYQEMRMVWGVQHSEIKCRVDMRHAALVEFKSIDSAHILFSFYIKEKERVGAREFTHRGVIHEEEAASRMALHDSHALLALMVEETRMRQRLQGDEQFELASSAEINDIRLRRRKEEEARVAVEAGLRRQLQAALAELDRSNRDKVVLQNEVSSANDALANALFEMKVLKASYETTQVKNNDLVAELEALRGENKALKGEVAGLNAMCAAVQRSACSSPSPTTTMGKAALGSLPQNASMGSLASDRSGASAGDKVALVRKLDRPATPRGGLQRRSPGRKSTASPNVTKARSPSARVGDKKKKSITTAARGSSSSPKRITTAKPARTSVTRNPIASTSPHVNPGPYPTSPRMVETHTPPRLSIISPASENDLGGSLGGSFSILSSTAALRRMH